MKKIFTLLLSSILLLSCTDYDSQFDQLDAKIKELAAANAALEAQLGEMAQLNATVSAQTATKLAEFQEAVGGIVTALTKLGQASEATIQQVAIIIARIAALAEAVEANAITAAGIAEEIAAIQAMLDTINENVLHHSGGGSTAGTGSEHHSGGGSTAGTGSEHHSGGGSSDTSSSEATGTDYSPAYSNAFDGATVADNVYTWPTSAAAWAGFANANTDIYPLAFPNGGTITFTASAASPAGVKFRFEKNPYPDVNPNFETEIVTISGASATEYTVTIPAQDAANSFRSALLYITTRDVGVTITDIVINVAD